MRAIVGISMGGFGAVKLALQHPELFILRVESVPRSTFPGANFP
jgi:S-formylglutathione hydrolase FrmB